MNLSRIFHRAMWFYSGMVASTLLFHLRFTRDHLWEEFMILGQTGYNNYFLPFVFAELILFVILVGTYFALVKTDRKKNEKNK